MAATLSLAFFTGWQTAQAHAATVMNTTQMVTSDQTVASGRGTNLAGSQSDSGQRATRPQNINGYYPAANQTSWANQQGQTANGWQATSSDSWYLFNQGQLKTGWQQQDQNWYYLNPQSARMATGLTKIDNSLYYLNSQHDGSYGAMQTGWQEINQQWYYFQSSGQAQSGWSNINGQSYYFDPQTNQMKTGDVLIGKNYYGFAANGYQVKGLALMNNQQDLHYYDPQTGVRQTSLTVGNRRYSFNPVTGNLDKTALKNGVSDFGSQQYYYQAATGKFVTNAWEQANGSWYYFNNIGQATHGWYQSQAGAWYLFNTDGSAKTGWYQSPVGLWCYFNPTNAWAETGWQKINGSWYYFNPTSTWALGGWYQSAAGFWYYFDPVNANAHTGWQLISGQWYYFDPTDAWAQVGWRLIDGNWYYFKSSAAMASNEYFMDGNQAYWADGSGHTSAMSGRDAFLASIEQAAIDGWKQFGVLPSVTVAQAILESGWGQSRLATDGHNLFGIKGSYNGQSITMQTAEYGGGGYYYVNAAFRRYPSNYESIVDHGRFLAENSRYGNLLWNKNYWDVTAKLQADGYATAPTYASSLNQVIQTYGLASLDQKAFS